MKNAQIHRFHDRAAIALPGNGATVYLTVKEARAIAKALNACARSIKDEPRYSTSTFATVAIDVSIPDNAHN